MCYIFMLITSTIKGFIIPQELIFLEKFTFFPRLPLELRRKIWRATFPDPQTVVRAESLFNYLPRMEFSYSSDKFLALVKDHKVKIRPVALRVNSESRAEALMAYGTVLPPKVFSSPAAINEIIFPLCFAPGKDSISIKVDFMDGSVLLEKIQDVQRQAPGKIGGSKAWKSLAWIRHLCSSAVAENMSVAAGSTGTKVMFMRLIHPPD